MFMDLREQLKNLFPDHVEQEYEAPAEHEIQQTPLVCKYEKKGRNGKPVTLVEGFEGDDKALRALAAAIKKKLGIGGSEKDGVLIIQGDNRDKIMQLLHDLGYKTKRVGG